MQFVSLAPESISQRLLEGICGTVLHIISSKEHSRVAMSVDFYCKKELTAFLSFIIPSLTGTCTFRPNTAIFQRETCLYCRHAGRISYCSEDGSMKPGKSRSSRLLGSAQSQCGAVNSIEKSARKTIYKLQRAFYPIIRFRCGLIPLFSECWSLWLAMQ